jgi:hypothetical protein
MFKKIAEKEGKVETQKERCNICGATYHKSNRARHKRTRKHNDADFINNKIYTVKKLNADFFLK